MNRPHRLRIAAAVALLAAGCAEEPARDTGNGGATGTTTSSTTESAPGPPGARCAGDADCAGDRALCLLGVCMTRAEGACPAPGTEQGCPAGATCFDTDMLADTGVCFPSFDAASCAGVENRLGLCSPVRGDSCDAGCGAACAASGVAPGNAGAPCDAAADCSLSKAQCYSDALNGIGPHGWVDGYCLSPCKKDGDCGPEAGCFPIAGNGGGVCMNTCGMDLDCRAGYVCRRVDGEEGSFCSAGCDAAATCPAGTTCLGPFCVSDEVACSEAHPHGFCPPGSWCDAGKCNDAKFSCGGAKDALEPNDTLDSASPTQEGTTEGLTLCEGDEDWIRVEVPAKTIVRVGIRFENAAGDVDLVAYDEAGTLLSSRMPETYPYPYSYRDEETGTEYFGFYSEAGGATYYVRALGYKGAQNVYSLHVDSFPYTDGPSCEGAGYSHDDCAGKGAGGSGLLPFPFADPADSVVGKGYVWETFGNYRFARRETIMAVRHALSETLATFPGTPRVSLVDACQIDGVTPGYDVGAPRHPVTTHDQGGNIDIAYFQTDGSNDGEVICGDGTTAADAYCTPEAAQTNIVDFPRQAFFMAKLYANPRTRVIGVDRVIGPLLQAAAKELRDLPAGDPRKITEAEYQGFLDRIAWGDGWPYHQHHIHLSMRWWSQDAKAPAPESAISGSPALRMEAPGARLTVR